MTFSRFTNAQLRTIRDRTAAKRAALGIFHPLGLRAGWIKDRVEIELMRRVVRNERR